MLLEGDSEIPYSSARATIAVLVREFGAKRAALIGVTEVALAVALGGVVYRVSLLLGVR